MGCFHWAGTLYLPCPSTPVPSRMSGKEREKFPDLDNLRLEHVTRTDRDVRHPTSDMREKRAELCVCSPLRVLVGYFSVKSTY